MRLELTLATDQHGMLTGARAHDGILVDSRFSTSTFSYLKIRRLDGGIAEIEMHGVSEFTINQLWNNAVVGDIFLWKVDAVPEICWDVPGSGWNALLYERAVTPVVDLRREAAARIVKDRPNAFLMTVDFSYGGDRGGIALVCDRVIAYDVGV